MGIFFLFGIFLIVALGLHRVMMWIVWYLVVCDIEVDQVQVIEMCEEEYYAVFGEAYPQKLLK